MTKREFQQKHGTELAVLVGIPTFIIALDVAREDCPYFRNRSTDATSIIRNDGCTEGWTECLKFLKSLSKSEPEHAPPRVTPLYEDPDKRKTDLNQ